MKERYILVRERSQSKKATHYMLPTMGRSRKGQTTETIERSVAAGGREMNGQSTEDF